MNCLRMACLRDRRREYLRARPRLYAADLGQLFGASGQSVYNWEAGTSVPRENLRMALTALRGIGKREVLNRLEMMA